MEDINKNLTPDQTAGIKAQDVTNQNVIDVDVLESKQEGIPEAAEPNNAGTAVQSLAQTALDARAEEKAQAEVARQEAITLQKEVSDREGTISALSGEVLGQGQAQTAAIEDAGLNKKQAEIDETDRNIQALTTKIAKQEIQDNLQVSQLAGRGLGIPAGIVRGQQSLLSGQLKAKRDSDSADLANLIASSALFQGKVDNAKLALKEQIELEFGDKERELELEIGFLERTDAKLAKVKEKELAEIQRQKDEARTVFGIQAMAAGNNAPQSVLSKIGQAETEAEALQLAGRYSVSIGDRIKMSQRSDEIKDRKQKKELIQARIESGEIVLSKEQRDTAFKLSDDWEKESKNTKQTVDSYNKFVGSVNRAIETESPASHLAVVFNYMKTLDPTSVVRESEFASAADAAKWMQEAGDTGINVPLPVAQSIRKLETGELLSPAQLEDFGGTVKTFYDSAIAQQDKVDEQFSTRASQFGVPSDVVVRDLRSPLQLAETPEEKEKAVEIITNEYSNSVIKNITKTNLYGGLNID